MSQITRSVKIGFRIPLLGITDKQYVQLSFGRRIEHDRKIAEWKAGARRVHISQKRRTHAKAIREFKLLYSPVEWYYQTHDSPEYRDDSFEVFYKLQEDIELPSNSEKPT